MSKNRPTPNPIINREIKIKKNNNNNKKKHFQRSRKEEILKKKKRGHIQRIKNKNDFYLPKNETESQS